HLAVTLVLVLIAVFPLGRVRSQLPEAGLPVVRTVFGDHIVAGGAEPLVRGSGGVRRIDDLDPAAAVRGVEVRLLLVLGGDAAPALGYDEADASRVGGRLEAGRDRGGGARGRIRD